MNILNALARFIEQYSAKIFFFCFAYTLPIHSFLVTIYILLFFDLVTGLTKAVKSGVPITSKRLRDSVLKFIFYSIATYISFQVDITILFDALILTKLVGGYIMLIEFQSNIENISEITGVNLWMLIKDKVLEIFNTKLKGNSPDA
jgi:hypothetical protein